MPESIIESLFAFIPMIFRYEMGTVNFYIELGCVLTAVIVVARILAGVLGSQEGLFVAAFAILLPPLVGAFGYVLVELYALPEIKAEWAPDYLPWSVFAGSTLLVAIILSSSLWSLGKGSTIFIIVLAGLAGIGAQYGAHRLVDDVLNDVKTAQVEKRSE